MCRKSDGFHRFLSEVKKLCHDLGTCLHPHMRYTLVRTNVVSFVYFATILARVSTLHMRYTLVRTNVVSFVYFAAESYVVFFLLFYSEMH